ncbi:MAG: hypothetical protein IKL55_05505 [Clostridia bacterium]|nr:hypothetical protein [Clostridia bacterium]
MKNNKKLIGVLLLITLILVIFLAGYTFARYYKSINAGGGTANIARWSFGSKNEKAIINLSEEKIAPGSNGQFEIEVDATNSEVDVDYEILVSEEKNIPTNMKFYAETKDEKGVVLSTTEKNSSFTELATNNLKGTIPVEANNQKRSIVVYWEWEFNENDTTTIDSEDATLKYDENGNSNLECGFNIEIVGRQAKK